MSFFVIQKMSSLLIILPLHKIVMKIIPTSKIWTILNLRIKNPHKTHGLHCSPKRFFFISWNLVNFSDKYFPISMKIISVFTDTEMWKLFCIQSWFYVNFIHTFQQFFLAIKIHLHMYICGVFVPLIKD